MTDGAAGRRMTFRRALSFAKHSPPARMSKQAMSESITTGKAVKDSIVNGNAASDIRLHTSKMKQRTCRYLHSVESKAYSVFHALSQWQNEQLYLIEQSPTAAKRVVDSTAFSTVVFLTISLNAIISAVLVNYRAEGGELPEAFSSMDNVFLLIYTIEASIRVLAYGRVFFLESWNLMDLAIIFIDVMDRLMLTTSTHILLFRMLRSMRLLRLLRSLRMFHALRVVWNSYIAGMASLIWANVLLMLFTFIWAVFLTDVFIEAPLATGEAASMFVQDQETFIKIYFGSVLKSMVTLFQVCTLESWANGIMRPAEAIVPGLQWVFIAYVMLMTFGLVNMIIGVFVERCSAVEKHETEFHRGVLEDESNDQLEQLRDLFQGYDEIGNSDGMITLDEFEKMSEDPRFCAILDGITQAKGTSLTELFEAMDYTGDGMLDFNKFVQGISLVKAAPTGLDLSNCCRLVRKMQADHYSLRATVESLGDKIDLILTKLDRESGGLPLHRSISGEEATLTTKSLMPYAPQDLLESWSRQFKKNGLVGA
jgi:voltage-gated sodium channel